MFVCAIRKEGADVVAVVVVVVMVVHHTTSHDSLLVWDHLRDIFRSIELRIEMLQQAKQK